MAAKVFVLIETAVGRNKEMVTALKQPEGLKVRCEDIREKRNVFIVLKRPLKDYGYSLLEILVTHSSRSARSTEKIKIKNFFDIFYPERIVSSLLRRVA